jgi:signal transduction histidine kinase
VRGGFCAVVFLLLASAFEGYLIPQVSDRVVSAQHPDIDKVVARFRQSLNLGVNAARDFFLNHHSDRRKMFRVEVEKSRSTGQQALGELDQIPEMKSARREIGSRLNDFWQAIDGIQGWPDATVTEEAYDFIRQELPLRRRAVGEMLNEFTDAAQNARKRSQNELAGKRQEHARRLILILGTCVALSLGLATYSLSYVGTLERDSARRCEEIERAKGDLQQLSARLLNVQEEERKRLSRELHDGIGQTLTALRIEISRVGGPGSNGGMDGAERLMHARSLAEEAVRTTRDIALLLRPSILDDLGLEAALRWQAEEFTRRTGIPCEYANQSLQEHLPEAWKTCVYRIVQEAISNCQKHAAPTRVRVSLRQESEMLTLEVEDDGCGFVVNDNGTPARSPGLGLLGMRERAAMLGGSITISSSPGRGTKLVIRLPLAHIKQSAHIPAETEV